VDPKLLSLDPAPTFLRVLDLVLDPDPTLLTESSGYGPKYLRFIHTKAFEELIKAFKTTILIEN
jgi:hypothetical protein